MTNARHYMQKALSLARRGLGRTSPNPPVGAVVVKNGKVVGTGFHPEAGQPHAEIFALREAGCNASGADLFVTLEPCSHHGRTGPCADALVHAQVKKVYVGTVDPNPQVSGLGIDRLRAAGVEVDCGILEAECKQMIAPFAKHITTGLPFVIYKSAMTIDGQIATSTGESQWISCDESRQMVHQLRDHTDGIMVGSGTVCQDNPRLTTRSLEGGRDPVRIIVDSKLVTDPEALVYSQQSDARAILITSIRQPAERLHRYAEAGVQIELIQETGEGIDLHAAMHRLGALGIQSILLEGGGRLAGALLHRGLLDRFVLFVAPLFLGGNDGRPLLDGTGVAKLKDAYRLTDVRVTMIGTDILIEGEVAGCSLE